MTSSTAESVAAESVTKHPEFSSADGDEHLWLRAENVLFCVHKFILGSKSPLFNLMLTLPPPPGPREGTTEDVPIVLHGVKVAHLELLLGLVYWSYEREKRTYTLSELLDILELASMLLVPDCRGKALDLLATHDIPAAKQLQLAVNCQVPEWVDPAFRRLVSNFGEITPVDAAIMGHRLFYSVSMTRHLLTQCRLSVVAFAGEFKVNHNCEAKETCRTNFRHLFDSGFARLYNSPSTPLQAANAMAWFENNMRTHLCTWCWSSKWYSLAHEDLGDDGVSVFQLEEKVLSNAVQDIVEAMAPFPVD